MKIGMRIDIDPSVCGIITNGEVIKALFSHYDIEIDEHKGYVRIIYEDFYTTYPLMWWNAPYKREGNAG